LSGRPPATTTATAARTARGTTTRGATGGRSCLLLQPSTRAGPDASLQLFALRLQHRGSEERNLLALLDSV
jgi:hypothetical protein